MSSDLYQWTFLILKSVDLVCSRPVVFWSALLLDLLPVHGFVTSCLCDIMSFSAVLNYADLLNVDFSIRQYFNSHIC